MTTWQRRRLAAALAEAEARLTAPLDRLPIPDETEPRVLAELKLGDDPTDLDALTAWLAAADDPAAAREVALLLSLAGRPGGALAAAEPLAALVRGSDQPASARYAALLEAEGRRRDGVVLPLWRELLVETGDTEELARLRERTQRRWATPPPPGALPVPAQRGLEFRLEQASAPAVAVLDAELADLEQAVSDRETARALRWRCWLADALCSPRRAAVALALARRRVESDRRAADDDRHGRALRGAALLADAALTLHRLAPSEPAAPVLHELAEQVLGAQSERLLDHLEARAAVAAGLAESGLVADSWRVLSAGRVGQGCRGDLVRQTAARLLAQPPSLAIPALAGLRAHASGEPAVGLLRAALAEAQAEVGDASAALDTLAPVRDLELRVAARCAIARAAAPGGYELARAIWEAGCTAAEVAQLPTRLLVDWHATELELASGNLEVIAQVQPGFVRRVRTLAPELREPLLARCCAVLAAAGERWLEQAARLADELVLPSARAVAWSAVGAARCRLEPERGAKALGQAWSAAVQTAESYPSAGAAAPLEAWCQAILGLPAAVYAEQVAAAWYAVDELRPQTADLATERLAALLCHRLGRRVGGLVAERVGQYRDELRPLLQALP